MSPSPDPAPSPRGAWAERLAGILAGSFAIPLLGEILLAVINNQQFDYVRTAITAMVLGIGAAILYASQVGRIVFERARAAFLIVAGFVTATQGFLQAARPEWMAAAPIEGVVGMITLVLGLAVFAIGWFYFRVEGPAKDAAIPAQRKPPTIEQVTFDRVPGRFDPVKHTKYFDACRAALSMDQLHYVAYYEGRTRVFNIDVFDRLEDFQPVETTQAARRQRYNEHGPQIVDLLRELNTKFDPLETGPLIRMVFDVEQGAIFYYMISSSPAVHVVGVTLDQAQIHTADHDLELLSVELRRRSGRLPITKENT
ncbi:hypothetical protein Cs7R123_72160 [Catellatospora sp. TT07R-123]|uniref:hypothetical protein n=1 Tax=Catellatospora sp. TT07R-123 TaxID=2733863 RepID=UPI001AFD1C87|nr:hypothetical protein [Catellatospora sp. TT07R-123]GHJ49874.1 hypothetical protein Cs7R123_72160 [Catellatospora sp. TT07R-123]